VATVPQPPSASARLPTGEAVAPSIAVPAPTPSAGADAAAQGSAAVAQNDLAQQTDPERADEQNGNGSAQAPQRAQEGQAVAIVRTVLLPRTEAFADKALALQNAVLRHCHIGSDLSRRQMVRAFDEAIKRVAPLVLSTFASEVAETAPTQLLTPVADTAFSRSRLIGFVTTAAQPPPTLPALRQEGVALQGLPALEATMVEGIVPDRAPLDRRCRLATVVAAAVTKVAEDLVRTWQSGAIAEHWRGDRPELADRLRLRDLVQGMIFATVRLNRDMSLFVQDPGRNPDLPFAARRSMISYLDALAAGLVGQADLLRTTGEPDEDAFALLSSIMTTLEQGRLALRTLAAEETPVVPVIPFQQVQNAVLNRLPVALGFDTTAFQYPPAAVADETN
jgi:predicted lipoprotein